MWITLENGHKANVRKSDFVKMKKSIIKQNPKEIATSAMFVLLNSKQLMNDIVMETKAFMQQMEADSLGIGINGDKK